MPTLTLVPRSPTSLTLTAPYGLTGLSVYNVKDYGALGDGATDDAAAINAAATAAAAAGGILFFPAGTFIVGSPITLNTKVHVCGVGIEATIVKLKASANSDVFKSANFATLTGTNSVAGIYNFSIRDLTVDGTKASNSSGYGIRVYGYGYIMENVRVRNCAQDGLYSEWSTSANAPASGDSMEAQMVNVKSHENAGNGVTWSGPHDSTWVNGHFYLNSGKGVAVAGAGNGVQFVNCHSWGQAQTYAWHLTGNAFLINCVGEGAITAQVYLGANDCQIIGGDYFGSGAATPVGIEVAGSTAGHHIDTKVLNCTSGSFKFTSDGGNSMIRALVFQASGTVYTGTPSVTTRFEFYATGGATGGGSFLPVRGTKDMTMNDGTGDLFNVNTNFKFFEFVRGSLVRGYSDSYSTLKWMLDSSSGNFTNAGSITHTGTTVGLNGNTPVAKAAAITAPTAPSAGYVQAEAQSMKTAVDAIRVALANIGITA